MPAQQGKVVTKAAPKVKAAPKAKTAPKKAAAVTKKAPVKKTAVQTKLTVNAAKLDSEDEDSELIVKPKANAARKRVLPESDEDASNPPDRASLHDDSLLSITPPSAKKQKRADAPKKVAGARKAADKPLQDLENDQSIMDDVVLTQTEGKPKMGKAAEVQYQKVSSSRSGLERGDTMS